jgi:hypothetical protein
MAAQTVNPSTETADRPDDADNENGAESFNVPLAYGSNAEPIELAENAVGWRVSWRKLGERGGSPSPVYVKGRPLILSLDATAEDLMAAVGGKAGRYRLDPIDEEGRTIPDAPPAYAVNEKDFDPANTLAAAAPAAAAAPTGSQGTDLVSQLLHHQRELVAANQAAVKALHDSFATQSQQVAQVLAACADLVSGSPRRVVIQQPAAAPLEDAGKQPLDWNEALKTLNGVLPMIKHIFSKPMTIVVDQGGNVLRTERIDEGPPGMPPTGTGGDNGQGA